ncbi:MAG: GNAT family N-acetyltransferase [Bacteroidales bacterium]|nr:GNAT family N-acetyltransferase [Bacteroidales bacterium]
MNISLRSEVFPQDVENIRNIVESTGFFYPHEVKIAVELVEERLSKGPASGYEFLFAEVDGTTVGYSCFGLNPSTKKSFDLYWIATFKDLRGKGIGKFLLEETCRKVKEMGGTAIYAETSGRPLYKPTRMFYENNGFICEAVLRDFYDDGDDKLIFVRRL